MFQQLLQQLNWLHIAVAALAYYAIGAIWYGGLFTKPWLKAHNIIVNKEDQKKGMAFTMLMTFILLFIITTGLAVVYRFVPPLDIAHAIKYGAFYSVVFSCTVVCINYLYLRKPFIAFVIDGGYHVVGMIVASVIMSAWGF